MAWYEIYVKGWFDEKLAKFKKGEELYQPDDDDDDNSTYNKCERCPYCDKKLKHKKEKD